MKRLLLMAAIMATAGTAHADNLKKLVAGARAEGLPVAPLESKIREGAAKRIPAARIEGVVRTLVGHMRTSRTWLGKGGKKVRPAVLVAVSQARLSGVPQKQLQQLVKPGSKVGVSRRVDSMVDLHARGYRGGAVVDLVRQVKPGELPVLGKTVDAVRRRTGQTRDLAARSLADALGRGGQRGLHKVAAGMGRGGSHPPPGGGPGGGPPPGPHGPGAGGGTGPGPGPKGPGPHHGKAPPPRKR